MAREHLDQGCSDPELVRWVIREVLHVRAWRLGLREVEDLVAEMLFQERYGRMECFGMV